MIWIWMWLHTEKYNWIWLNMNEYNQFVLNMDPSIWKEYGLNQIWMNKIEYELSMNVCNWLNMD